LKAGIYDIQVVLILAQNLTVQNLLAMMLYHYCLWSTLWQSLWSTKE